MLDLPPDLRDDYCYWPMISAIAVRGPGRPRSAPSRDPGYQFMTRPDDVRHIELRHPCARCR